LDSLENNRESSFSGDFVHVSPGPLHNYGVLQVVRNRQFALGRIAGEWEMIESSSLKVAKEEFRRLNDNLHDQMEQIGQLDRSKTILDERLRIEASASEQLQRLSAHLIEQQDEERRWIAAELHEVTAQNVSAIGIYLSGLQQKTSAQASEVKSILAKCQALFQQSLEQILTLSHRLHPPTHDRFGLAAQVCTGHRRLYEAESNPR
jgi:signal transduction histidine kinase